MCEPYVFQVRCKITYGASWIPNNDTKAERRKEGKNVPSRVPRSYSDASAGVGVAFGSNALADIV